MKSKAQNELRERLNICNPWNYCEAGGGYVYIDYNAATKGRGGRSAHIQVIATHGHTDVHAAWYDYGRKTWTCSQLTRAERLDEAKAWATEKYGITDWIKDPFGGWQDARVVARVKELLKAKVAA
jgi:hypothetical protein